MWVVGVILLILLTSGSCLALASRLGVHGDEAPNEIWDVAGTARTYTTIVGALAGFSVTSSIFIANLTVARQSPAFESVMALFLTAFLIFISAGMQFGTTPNLPQHPTDVYRTIQGYSYLLANASYYLALSLSWLGLPLLLSAVGLEFLSDIFIWMVFFAVLGGALRLCGAGLGVFARIDLRVSLLVPAISFILAAVYRLAVASEFEMLLPESHEPALFAVLCFVVGAVGFGMQSAIATSAGYERRAAAVANGGERFLLAYVAGVVTTTSLLWQAVAAAL